MKPAFFFFALLLCGLTVQAQTAKSASWAADSVVKVFELPPNAPLWVRNTSVEDFPGLYCEVSLHGCMIRDHTYWYAILVNTGEEIYRPRFLSLSIAPTGLHTEQGYVVVQNAVQMLNLMHERGWNLQEILAHTDSSSTSHSYLFKRANP